MGTEFVTPDRHVFLDALGVEAQITGETQLKLKLIDVTGEDFEFSFDITGRSIRVAWQNASGKELLTIFREGATLLRIAEGAGTTKLVTNFETRDTTGELAIQVFPEIKVEEKSLFL